MSMHTATPASRARLSPLVPQWLTDAVFYQIFPERFRNGDRTIDPDEVQPWGAVPTRDNFCGGDLWGIIEGLDHIASIGANTLYLTPVFTATTNHRYDGIDYFSIDPLLGGDAAFDALINACHARGMRVVLDGVFNHCGSDHPYFQDVIAHEASSPYVNWYMVDDFPVRTVPEPNFKTCSGCVYMPKWNTHNPDVRDHHLRVAVHWLERGADGWRLDVPWFINKNFWRLFRTTVKERFPQACLIGEEWKTPTHWLHGDTFDGTMNYGLRDLALDFTARRIADGAATADAALALQRSIPPSAAPAMMNLLGSHDTDRVRTVHSENTAAQAQALAILFAYPGAPMIYYGDEIGVTGEDDPGCRACMPWDESTWNRQLLDIVTALAAARRDCPAYGRGSLDTPFAAGDVLILRTTRTIGAAACSSTTVINRSPSHTAIPRTAIPVDGRILVSVNDGRLSTNEALSIEGEWVVVPGLSVLVMEGS
ncbi:glycoside hydrolase family 13 protein [Actinomyces sp. B33]|uniref:glycoside hydrolase family 13 protein n=1 Tax=Actinomyces sp. B33 TaxID=2942131 RepID=UPI0023406915|nr:glycoside hydrolase family 13 protein [Actinomyces sp. B33]MDC4233269.1 glycoside hydrolase family 13 protein [Actinomyces sp. B33]